MKFTERLETLTKENGFLMMVHRGFWGGNIPQNTKESAALAFKTGAEIIEIDVARSQDGEYYLFHTGYELPLLGIDKPFDQISSAELDECYLINGIHMVSSYKIVKFRDYLEWFPKDKIINIDRSWWYWNDPKFYQLIEETGMVENVFVKNRLQNTEGEYLKDLNAAPIALPYMPIIESQAEYELIKQYPNLNVVGVEIIVKEADCDLIDPAFTKMLRDQQLGIIADGERLGRDKPFYLGREDDHSILENSDEGWGVMIDNGATIIETDWPNFLADYRRQR